MDIVSGWPEEEYTDDMRLDEMNTAEDYNRFEENQLALDRDAGEFDDYDRDPDGEWGGEPYWNDEEE